MGLTLSGGASVLISSKWVPECSTTQAVVQSDMKHETHHFWDNTHQGMDLRAVHPHQVTVFAST